MNAMIRFFSKVNKTSTCWVWLGSTNGKGYGEFWDGSKKVLAHRFMAIERFGEIPDGKEVCHDCDNPSCVNPDHLFLGSRSDNMMDAVRKGRHKYYAPGLKAKKTPCKGILNGQHKLTDEHIRAIRNTPNFRGRGKMLAEKFGVSETLICLVLNGEIWKHIK